MNRHVKKIDINYKNNYICVNNKYFIDISKKPATVYNMIDNKDIPTYIFKWIKDNHLL